MQIERRRFVNMALGGGTAAALAAWYPAWAQPVSAGVASTLPTVSGNDITLRIARQTMRIDGKVSRAIGINGTVPGPLVRLKEGQTARLTVVNDLDVDSSIHWHGLILPFQMDGVPGVSFPGIKPRSTFVYEFPVVQSGTYWYHSHRGCRNSWAITARSSSIRRAPTRSVTTANMSSCCPTTAICRPRRSFAS